MGLLMSYLTKKTIKTLRYGLLYLIDIDYGLLHELRRLNVLTTEQIEVINSKHTKYSRVGQMLDDVISLTSEQLELFLKALELTNQKHVVNYIYNFGQRVNTNEDWPFLLTPLSRSFHEKYPSLEKIIDSSNGLLDELLSNRCLNYQQKECVKTKQTNSAKNELLLSIMSRKGEVDYKNFITCLMKTKQHRVASLLAPDIVGSVEPLSEEQDTRLTRNYADLVSLLDSEYGLTAEMLALDIITSRHKEIIESTSSRSERNTRLLDIVRRGSKTDFDKFIDCLDQTGQRYASRILREDGVVIHIEAKTNISKQRVVEEFKTLLESKTPEERQQLLDDVSERVGLQLRDTELVATKTGHRIELYYFCKSFTGLQNLYESYISKQFNTIVEELFGVLLGANVHVNSLVWQVSNYNSSMVYFHSVNNRPEFSMIYQLAQQSLGTAAECSPSSIRIDELPFELIEMILMKAACHLFVDINRMTSRAEVYTLATLSAVSSLWGTTITHRKFNKIQLKRSFKRVCHPFKCSPQQVTSLHIEGGNNVRGVAVLNYELFVACHRSNKIQVFDSRPPFSRQEDIQVEGLHLAIDITVCNKSSSLFIADYRTECAPFGE